MILSVWRGQALLTPEDAVLSDELNHASIIDGIRLCKANKYRYKHMDMQDLEAKLKEAQVWRAAPTPTPGHCLAVLPAQYPGWRVSSAFSHAIGIVFADRHR